MGTRFRRRQSNTPEYCPLCAAGLSVRSAAVSHYRAHERAGDLVARTRVQGRSTSWYLPPALGTDAIWFQIGFAAATLEAATAAACTAFITSCRWGRAGRRGGCDPQRRPAA